MEQKEWIVKWTNGYFQFLPEKMQPLIRCKDCVYRHTNDCICERAGNVNIPDDWFCADGVQKEKGEYCKNEID